jgi:uncharacterized protein
VTRSELPSGDPAPGWLPHGSQASFWVLAWVAGAYLACQLLVALLSLHGRAPDLMSLGAAEALAYTGAIYLVLHRYERGTPLRVALGLRPTQPALVFAGMGLGASFKLPAEQLTALIERHFPSSDAQLVARAELFRTVTWVDVLVLSLVTCLVAPLVEELLFRGAIYGRLVKISVIGAALATGLSFVLVHADPRQWPALLLIAAALSYLRAVSGSLLPALGLHVTFNATGVLALVLGAASPTRPLNVSWAATTASWLAAISILVLVVRAAESHEAARAREEDRS